MKSMQKKSYASACCTLNADAQIYAQPVMGIV